MGYVNGTFKFKTSFMTNFVFDTWKTSAPFENQRKSIYTSYFVQRTWPKTLAYGWQKDVGPTQFSDVGPTNFKWCSNTTPFSDQTRPQLYIVSMQFLI